MNYDRFFFRGKHIKDGSWVTGMLNCRMEGFYSITRTNHIGAEYHEEITPATLGQCTGQTTRKKHIFEGDLLASGHNGVVGIVSWEDGRFIVAGVCIYGKRWKYTLNKHRIGNSDCYVCGNIHDDPELVPDLENKLPIIHTLRTQR